MASNPAAGLDFDLDRLMNVLERKQSDRMASQRVDDAVRTAAQAKATESVSESISAATSSAARAAMPPREVHQKNSAQKYADTARETYSATPSQSTQPKGAEKAGLGSLWSSVWMRSAEAKEALGTAGEVPLQSSKRPASVQQTKSSRPTTDTKIPSVSRDTVSGPAQQAGTSWAGSLFSSFGFAATADSASNSSGNNRSDAASASASESRSAPPGLDSIFSKEEILTMEKQRQMQAEQYRLEAERKKRERASENPSTGPSAAAGLDQYELIRKAQQQLYEREAELKKKEEELMEKERLVKQQQAATAGATQAAATTSEPRPSRAPPAPEQQPHPDPQPDAPEPVRAAPSPEAQAEAGGDFAVKALRHAQEAIRKQAEAAREQMRDREAMKEQEERAARLRAQQESMEEQQKLRADLAARRAPAHVPAQAAPTTEIPDYNSILERMKRLTKERDERMASESQSPAPDHATANDANGTNGDKESSNAEQVRRLREEQDRIRRQQAEMQAARQQHQLASERRRAEELRARMGNLGASPQTAKPSKPWVQEAFQQAESFQHINHSTAGADATKSYAALERERVQREREELDRKREEQVERLKQAQERAAKGRADEARRAKDAADLRQQQQRAEWERLRQQQQHQQQQQKERENEERKAWEEAFQRRQAASYGARPQSAAHLGGTQSCEQMEQRWKQLEASSSVSFSDIPWPPLGSKNVIQWAATQAGGRVDASTRKRVYRQLVLRWHPDKFEAKFGSKVNAGEKNRILEKVQEISQGINQEAESMKARSMM